MYDQHFKGQINNIVPEWTHIVFLYFLRIDIKTLSKCIQYITNYFMTHFENENIATPPPPKCRLLFNRCVIGIESIDTRQTGDKA